MEIHLTKRDYWATALVLGGLFIGLPFFLWGIHTYRSRAMEREVKTLVDTVLRERASSLGSAAYALVEAVEQPTTQVFHEVLSLADEQAISQVCDELEGSVTSRTSDYRLVDWSCAFTILTEQGFFEATKTSPPRRFDQYAERDQGTLIKQLAQSNKDLEISNNGQDKKVIKILQTEPIIALTIYLHPTKLDR